MPETLRQFRARVDGFTHDSLPHQGGFMTRESLRDKVSPEGTLTPFFGSTVIWELDDASRQALAEHQALLYDRCAACLAEPLRPDTFHVTLHDLVSDPDALAIETDAARTAAQAEAILASQRAAGFPAVHLRSTAMFSMVATSMVMGFAPQTEADCAVLMGLYEAFHAVQPLAWQLTPHVTLAYYRPGEISAQAGSALRSAIAASAALPPVSVVLQPEQLRVSRFRDMNHYL